MDDPVGQPYYDTVIYWVKHYGSSDSRDKRAVEDFNESETDDKVRVLKQQLYSIAQENYDTEMMDKLVGAKRRARHGSYHEWAKLMLLWLSNAKS